MALAPARAVFLVFGFAFATILAAWGFELAGYAPCELCLMQRWAYYAGVPLAGGLALGASSAPVMVLRAGLALLALVFVASAIFGVYHSGVEWGFWPGPSACTGVIKSTGDLLTDLKNTKVVRCDAVAIRILGLSLAGWNGVVSAGLAGLALAGWRAPISPSTP